jgi:hypothetical protein
MAFLKQCIPRPPTTPSLNENDDVYPVHTLDDTKTLRRLLLAWTICFNDALDAHKLRCALAKLLDIGDWRKVGGRLALKVKPSFRVPDEKTDDLEQENGSLQIRVPRKFTADRPAFAYSHENCAMNMESHHMAGRLPKTDGTISIWPNPWEFFDLAARPGTPTSFKHLLVGDTPQMSLHITSFFDATLVSIVWPHTLMDMIGQQAFLHAWSLVLAGRESEVPRVLDAREDVLQAIADTPTENPTEYKLRSRQLKGFGLAKFVARYGREMLRGPTPQTRTIFLPAKAMISLRREAERTLASMASGEKDSKFISDGDILTAWTLRAVATSLSIPQRITALHAMNARFRLPALIDASGICLQNMLVPGYTYLSPTEAAGPLGHIALRNRHHLLEQATEAQVLASLREQYKSGDFSKRLYSPSDAVVVPYTNWTKARIFQAANFRPAILCNGENEQTRCNPPGTPVFHHAFPVKPSQTTRLMVVVLGKDYGGNYWLTLTMGPVAWRKIMESLEVLGGAGGDHYN